MQIQILKSKIAYATLTHTELYYVGSITIAEDIMEQANIIANERVQVVNLNNGERLETYVIPGERGSNVFALNGPAARLAHAGDQVFILSYGLVEVGNPKHYQPTLIDMRELTCCSV